MSDSKRKRQSADVVIVGEYILDHAERTSGFPTRSNINRPVQLQKMGRSFKFWDLRRRRIVLSV